jgi:hypothetical protein
MTLTQESLEKAKSIERIEEAAAELYKALLAGRDTGKQRGATDTCGAAYC